MSDPPRSRLALYLALGYTLLIFYASLSPFTGWRDPGQGALNFLTQAWPRYVTRFDVIVNVLAYVPIGLFATLVVMPLTRPVVAAITGAAAGIALSFVMEAVQTYLPGRISTHVDLLTNAVGAIAGALLGIRAGTLPFVTQPLTRWRLRWFLPGGSIDLGIAVIALWFFSQLDPSLPLLGIVFFSNGIQAQLAGLTASDTFRVLGTISVAMNLVSLGLMLMLIMRSTSAALAALALLVSVAALTKLVAAATLLKSEAAFLWVSNEVAWAILAGAVFVACAAVLPRHLIRVLCALSLISAIVLAFLKPGEVHSFLSLRLFRWSNPQVMHYTGLAAAVAEAWPYAGLLYLTLLWRRDRLHV